MAGGLARSLWSGVPQVVRKPIAGDYKCLDDQKHRGDVLVGAKLNLIVGRLAEAPA